MMVDTKAKHKPKGTVKTTTTGWQQKFPLGETLQRVAKKVVHERVTWQEPHSTRRGPTHAASRKLTEEQVRDIRKRYNGSRAVNAQLSIEYGISPYTLYAVANGLSYAWVI